MIRLIILSCLMLSVPATAVEGEIVIPRTARATRPVTMTGHKVLAYGPALVSPRLKKTKDTLYLYLEGSSFGGQAGSAEIYLAFPPKGPVGPRTPIRIDPGDYISGEGSMEDGHPEPRTRIMEVHDFEVRSTPFRALTHLQAASQVYVAFVSPTNNFRFERVVITTEPPESRPVIEPPPTALACDRKTFMQWETGKVAENCMEPKSCVVDERLEELSCGGKANPGACMRQCLASGMDLIGKTFHTPPPDQSACYDCIARGYARYVQKCGAVCPACPRGTPRLEKKCSDCLGGEDVFAGCLPAE